MIPPEGNLAGEEFVHDQSEGPNVDWRTYRLPARPLFRSRVGKVCEAFMGRCLHRGNQEIRAEMSDAKISHDHVFQLGIAQDVFRLQIAMNDFLLMREFHRQYKLVDDPQDAPGFDSLFHGLAKS